MIQSKRCTGCGRILTQRMRRDHVCSEGGRKPDYWRVGAAAVKRRKAGGKLAVGRPSTTVSGWRALVKELRLRAGGRCEVCHMLAPLDAHHILKRSQGGPDVLWNLVALCRPHHDMTDAPWSKGRLAIWGDASPPPIRACWSIEVRADRWAPLEACLGRGLINLAPE